MRWERWRLRHVGLLLFGRLANALVVVGAGPNVGAQRADPWKNLEGRLFVSLGARQVTRELIVKR